MNLDYNIINNEYNKALETIEKSEEILNEVRNIINDTDKYKFNINKGGKHFPFVSVKNKGKNIDKILKVQNNTTSFSLSSKDIREQINDNLKQSEYILNRMKMYTNEGLYELIKEGINNNIFIPTKRYEKHFQKILNYRKYDIVYLLKYDPYHITGYSTKDNTLCSTMLIAINYNHKTSDWKIKYNVFFEPDEEFKIKITDQSILNKYIKLKN